MPSSIYNSSNYFTQSFIDALGFREYDARWILEPLDPKVPEIYLNYRGLTHLGNAMGRFLKLQENGAHETVLMGHDFRRYSENVKNALALGLLSSGMNIVDLGLCVSPMVYFGQYEYGVPACAMVTASHNNNGWTGVKIGHNYSQTFGPDRMKAFKEFTLESGHGLISSEKTGSYSQIGDALDRYVAYLKGEWLPRLEGLPRLRVAVETGNGTAGMVLPRLLEEMGFEVVAGNIQLDWNFPNFNPNPESIPFLRSVQALVKNGQADVGICIDGDGDRIGIVDNQGRIVFNDRVGLLIARKLETWGEPSTFVVDVKCTSLFSTQLESKVVWEKTGHSYIKAAVARENACAGFERSGHFFFNPPYGRGYDDASNATLVLLWILCRAKSEGKSLSDLLAEFPPSFQSPNRQPKVPEARKYDIVEAIGRHIDESVAATGGFSGVAVTEIVRINGVRVHFSDKSWLLIRASSNTPNLVVMAESFDADGARLKEIDGAVRRLFASIEGIGDFAPLYGELGE